MNKSKYKKIKTITQFANKYIILFTFLLSVFNFIILINGLPFPTKIKDDRIKIVRHILKDRGVLNKNINDLAEAIILASDKINVSPLLIISLMETESTFKLTAVSSQGYKGVLQTPTATMQYFDVDTLHGARILEDKIRYADGDLKEALILYKGGGRNKAARAQASQQVNEVYDLYFELKNKYGGL